MKLNTGFSKLTLSDLETRADTIVKSLTGNAKFPSPNPTLTEISGSAQGLRDAMASTAPNRTQAVAAARDALETGLSSLGLNLSLTPGVTDVDLATTGFDLPRPHIRTNYRPDAPQNLRLKPGNQSGEIFPVCDPVTNVGVNVYEAHWTLDVNAGPWQDAGTFSSSRTIILLGLPHGKDIWVRVRAIGTNGPGGWSDPATILVN